MGVSTPLREGLVSIIIPVYNVELYLEETLESVRRQSYDNWECICVDDGSRDGSADIVRHFSGQDARFRLLTQQNAGAAAARNTGLDHVRGEYTAFLDSDDLLRPEMLATCVDRMRQDNSDVCVFYAATLVGEKVNEDFRDLPKEAKGSHFCRETPSLRTRLFCHVHPFPWNKVYRTDMLRREKLNFPAHLKRCEDASFAVLALAIAKRISFVGRSLYLYRMAREGSQTSGMKNPQVCLDFVESCRLSWAGLRQRGLLSLYGVDNICHTWLTSLYYFQHLPSPGYVWKAYAMLNRLVRDNLRELRELGLVLSADEKRLIREYKAPVRWMYIRRLLRFAARYTGVEQLVHALTRTVGK